MPSPIDVLNYAKWEAWEHYKGMPQDEAQQKYIDYSESMIKKLGGDITVPDKAFIEKTYAQCVEKKLSEGATLA